MFVIVLRCLGAVLAGLVVAVLEIACIQVVSSMIYPPPADLDMNNPEALGEYMANMPLSALLLVLVSYAVGTLLGTWLATRLGYRRHFAHGIAVGLLLVLAGVVNMISLPHPAWFAVASVVVFLVFTGVGIWLARRDLNPNAS